MTKIRLFLPLLGLLAIACTTRTVITKTNSGPGEEAEETPTTEGDPTDPNTPPSPDAGTSKPDATTTPPAKNDASTPPPQEAGTPVPISGGKITVTCPSAGFHKPPPIEIASLPLAQLPRCSAQTKTCAYAAQTSAAWDACLAADTTPPTTFGNASVNCQACDRTQGSYCLASACPSEFTTYACCAQEKGDAACQGLLQAVTSCAGNAGKNAFNACIGSLVGACFAK